MMNKTIWMCWFQGENDTGMPPLNQECIKKWRQLNPGWQVNILSNKTIANYVPKYFDIIKESKFDRNLVAKSELIRLLLLNQYGGIWADASVYPMLPLDHFIYNILNDTGFFAYRFKKRSYRREIASWFLAANSQRHYLIKAWLDEFIDDFLFGPLDWNTGKIRGNVVNPSKYFEAHKALTRLYDRDDRIKYTIDNMVQIDEKIPHSALSDWSNRLPSYLYKRPKKQLLKS